MVPKSLQTSSELVRGSGRKLPQEQLDDLSLACPNPFPPESMHQVGQAVVERLTNPHREIGQRLVDSGG